MEKAFRKASEVIETHWLPFYIDSFPPIVINITDGEPTNERPTLREAKHLMSLSSNDGPTLLLNVHISATDQKKLILPASMPEGMSDYAKFLFEISSVLPAVMIDAARLQNLNPESGARGCVFNADADLLTRILVFASGPPAAGGAR